MTTNPARSTRVVIGSALTALVVGASTVLAPPAAAIYGGRPVVGTSLAFVAEVVDTAGGGACTGSLIHPSWVLTAAHCSDPASVGDLTVRVGNNVSRAGGELRRVTQILRPPEHGANGQSGHDDVALLELATPITTVTPVRLANPADAHLWDGQGADRGLITGWGLMAGDVPTTRLMYAGADVTPHTDDGVGINMINVASGPCAGDSGGPLLVAVGGTRVVAGVVKGVPFPCGPWPGSYSEVGAGTNRDWILRTLPAMPYTPFGVVDWDADGHQDIVAREEATGDLWFYPGRSVRTPNYEARAKIGNGWHGFTPFGLADWDGDGHQDIVARHDVTGDLWFYPGGSVRAPHYEARAKIGTGWRDRAPFGVTDWDGDGHQDILARDEVTGQLWGYPGRSLRTTSPDPRKLIGSSWQNRSPIGLGDWDNDGRQDIVTRANETGDQLLYRGYGGWAGTGTMPPARIGNDWQDYTPFDVADWDADGLLDVVARQDPTSDLWLYPGAGLTMPSPYFRSQIGRGW